MFTCFEKSGSKLQLSLGLVNVAVNLSEWA